MNQEQQEILTRISQLWEMYPQLRLGQLLVNVIGIAQPCPELFYCSDDKLLEELKQRLEATATIPEQV